MLRIGVLALQGAFAEHETMLDRIGVEHFQIRQKSDLDVPMDGLIVPGGESTAIGKLMKEVENDSRRFLQVMDICVRRNAYGRQLGSFFTEEKFAGRCIPMTFIRAPYIGCTGEGVEVLSVVDGHIVAARERNMLVTSFHPELSDDTTVHSYFINNLVRKA